MKKFKGMMCLFLAISVLLGFAISASATTHTINVNPMRQEQTNWCWAATSRMVIDYLGTWSPLPSQTNIVTTVKGSAVNDPATLDEMTHALEWYMVSTTRTGQISFSTVKNMLYGWYSPIETRIAWSSGGGHAQIIYGYEENGTAQGLYVIDPRMSGTQYLYYGFNEYISNSTSSWTHTWYNNKLAD